MRHAYHFTTAAAIVVLLTVGWLVLGSSASIAMAEVIKAATNHKIVRYKLTTIAQIKMKVRADEEAKFVPAESEDIVFCDLSSPRRRVERHEITLNDTVQSDWVTIQDNKLGKTLVMSSLALKVDEKDAKNSDQVKTIRMFTKSGDAGKKARLFFNSDEGLIPFTNVKSDNTFLEILATLQDNPNTAATKDSLDGRSARKYELIDQGAKTTVWVDAQTALPIRIEQELTNPRPNVAQWKWVFTDFAWDVDVEHLDSFFSTTPPSDYTLEDHTNGK